MKTIKILGILLISLALSQCSPKDDETIDISDDVIVVNPQVISIQEPEFNSIFSPQDTIIFKIRFRQPVSSDFKLTIRSDIDGAFIFAIEVDSQVMEIPYANLSKGEHRIDCVLNNGIEIFNSSTKRIQVGQQLSPIVWKNISSSDKAVTLEWLPSDIPDFKSYTIYRGIIPSSILQGEQIAVIENQLDSSFVDTTLQLDDALFYQIVLNSTTDCSGNNDDVMIRPGLYVNLNQNLSKMISDPVRDHVYGLTKDPEQILLLNMSSLQVEKRIDLGLDIVDIDVSPDGAFLYFTINDTANPGIGKINLVTQELEEIIPTDMIPYKLECGERYLYYQSRPPTSGSSSLYKKSLADGSESWLGTSRHGDIELSPDGAFLYHSEGNSSAPQLFKFETSSGNYIQEDINRSTSGHLVLSDNGQYLTIVGKVFQTDDLSIFSSGADFFYDLNSTGDLGIVWLKLIRLSDMSVTFQPPLFYTLGLFSNDETALYLYASADVNNINEDVRIYKINL